MKLAFACPYYGPTNPLVGYGQRANMANAAQAGHEWVEDYSSNGVQHREACEEMWAKAAAADIDALFWTEHDVVLPPDGVQGLVAALEATPQADIVTGVVFRRSPPYAPMVSMLDKVTPEQYERMKVSRNRRYRDLANECSLEEVNDSLCTSIPRICKADPPLPVDTASMGCLLIRKRTLERMLGWPELFAATKFLSIDNAFFQHCRHATVKLYCAPSVLCGHLGDQKVVTVDDWLAQLDEAIACATAKKELLNSVTLTQMVETHGTDKVRYLGLYGPLFASMKDTAKRVCEIGVWRGESLKLWADMFPQAQVYGIDLEDKQQFDSERITTFVADQEKRDELGRFIIRYGGDFDLILDDGGHSMAQQQISLGALFPHVRPGGWYVVEDVHTSVMYPGWGVEPNRKNTTLTMIERYTKTGVISSKYMTVEEVQYVADNIEWATLFKGEGPLSLTWVLKKRG